MDNVFDFFEKNKESVIKISKDKLSATLEPNDAGYTLKDILALLDNNGIKQGIDEATIKKMLEKEIYESPITVAKGKLPVDGEAGYYTYHFRTKMPSMVQLII